MAVREWLWRYGPAEVSGTVGALVAASVTGVFTGPAAIAYAGAIAETLAFYAVILTCGRRPAADRVTAQD